MQTETEISTDTASTHKPIEEKKNQVKKMHHYVLIFFGIWVLFIATFPIAFLRVSSHEKYNGGPFKSLDWKTPQRPADTY